MSNLSTTSDAILSSAQTLIAAGGYNGFSYADISDIVGIRKASIHHHFPGKAELVRVLVARYRETAEAAITGMEDEIKDPVALLRGYTGFWIACIADGSNPFCVCALLAGELPALPPEVAAEVRAYFRFLSGWLTSIIERGVESGQFAIANAPAIEAETLMATVHGAMLAARAYDNPAIFEAIVTPALQRLSAPGT